MEYTIIYPEIIMPGRIEFSFLPGELYCPRKVKALIKDAWQKGLQRSNLYDGIAYGFKGFTEKDGKLIINVRKTSYKEYYGTNVAHAQMQLMKPYFADIMAVCCLLETADGYFPLGLRSHKAAEMAEFWHVVGGNLQSMEEGEPFSSIYCEIEEETAITKPELENLFCLGMGLSLPNHKPEFLFYAKTKLTKDEFILRQRKAKDADEHTSFKFLRKNELNLLQKNTRFTPIGKAVLCQWQKHFI